MADSARPPEYDLAYAILAIAADPVKSRARLDELAAKEATLRELTDTLEEARADHERERRAALAASATAKTQQEILDAAKATHAAAVADLKARASSHASEVSRHAAYVAEAAAAHADKEAALRNRESAIQATEADIANRAAALSAQEADYQRRMDALSAIVRKN